jgi:hypothetical protein
MVGNNQLGPVYWVDAGQMSWQSAGKAGIALKAVRTDPSGLFLGQVGFEPMARSGLHQHQGTATSFFIDGGLSDYHGSAGLHQTGINLKGATHDAIAYQRTILVSRLEAPVTYPPQSGPVHGLHAGAHHSEVINAMPDVAPEINVSVDLLPTQACALAGTTRQMIFDYRATPDNRRMVQLHIRPETRWPVFEATGLIDLWIRGGELVLNGQAIHANCFVVIEPGQRVELVSPYGALVLAWAQGPVVWEGKPGDPFGFEV